MDNETQPVAGNDEAAVVKFDGWKPDICIYHSPCDDGFASAWIVRGYWPDCELIGTNYGAPFPGADYWGKRILIVDFSYPPARVAELMTKHGAQSIVMLDHHKTAQADLKDFAIGIQPGFCFREQDVATHLGALHDLGRPPVIARFDMEHSGAGLTWEFCYGREIPPMLVQHVEDRDLWRFHLCHTKAVSRLLRSYPYDFEQWSKLAVKLDSRGEENRTIMAEAHAIQRFYDHQVAVIAQTATTKTIGKFKNVPTAHAPYDFTSDVASALLKANPDAPFAAIIVDSYGGRTYSLRSDDNREDVSEVAKSFGGGGHRNAAGFRVPV